MAQVWGYMRPVLGPSVWLRACRLLVSHGGYTMRGRLKATNSCRMWSDVHVELTMTACHDALPGVHSMRDRPVRLGPVFIMKISTRFDRPVCSMSISLQSTGMKAV